MEKMKCANTTCSKVLTIKTEIEYSRMLGDYFCNADCAMDHYFDYMGSTPLNIDDLSSESEEVVVDGVLCRRDKY